jgi:hypothetical protein
MTTYEAYVALGEATVSISTVDVPLSVRSEQADVEAPVAVLTLVMPALAQRQPQVRLIQRPTTSGSTPASANDESEEQS